MTILSPEEAHKRRTRYETIEKHYKIISADIIEAMEKERPFVTLMNGNVNPAYLSWKIRRTNLLDRAREAIEREYDK